jgi:D-alanyl-D-alanine carboxypeptidase
MSESDRLQRVLDREVQARSVVGATADLFVDGLQLFSGAAGFVDREAGVAMSPGAVFPIYSITKTFTSVCALRLAAGGAIDLEAPVSTWLPALPFGPEVTLRALLAHTAGVADYSALPAYHEAVRAHPTRAWTFEEFVERTSHRPLEFAPGQGWNYSNTGYMLVRHALERETGRGLGALIEREVVRVLELQRTFALEELSDLQRVVPGYSGFWSEGSLEDVRETYHPGWCATGVIASTGAEVCRFFEALFDGRLLGDEELAQMLDLRRVPGAHPPAVTPSYGLGIMADPDSPRGRNYGHGGGGPGYNVHAAHFPSLDGRSVSAAVLCNGDEDHALPILGALLTALVDEDVRGSSVADARS